MKPRSQHKRSKPSSTQRYPKLALSLDPRQVTQAELYAERGGWVRALPVLISGLFVMLRQTEEHLLFEESVCTTRKSPPSSTHFNNVRVNPTPAVLQPIWPWLLFHNFSFAILTTFKNFRILKLKLQEKGLAKKIVQR